MGPLPDTIRFLESIGFTFSLDFDEQVEIEYPEDVTPRYIATEVGKYHESIRNALNSRAKILRRQFVGGPFNGDRHGRFPWSANKIIARQVRRAMWAVYEIRDPNDGRAWFLGYASSEIKAKRKELIKATA